MAPIAVAYRRVKALLGERPNSAPTVIEIAAQRGITPRNANTQPSTHRVLTTINVSNSSFLLLFIAFFLPASDKSGLHG